MKGHRMPFLALVVPAFLLLWDSGCEGKAGGGKFRIENVADSIPPGGEGKVSLRFVPRPGFHWNDEFPARLVIRQSEGVRPSRETFSSADQDFQSRDGVGVLDLPIAATPGTSEGRLKAEADFSICNAKECQIFKQVPVEVSIPIR